MGKESHLHCEQSRYSFRWKRGSWNLRVCPDERGEAARSYSGNLSCLLTPGAQGAGKRWWSALGKIRIRFRWGLFGPAVEPGRTLALKVVKSFERWIAPIVAVQRGSFSAVEDVVRRYHGDPKHRSAAWRFSQRSAWGFWAAFVFGTGDAPWNRVARAGVFWWEYSREALPQSAVYW